MLEDRYGLPLSTASAQARDAYVAGADAILGAVAGAERHLQAALAADPGFALAHAALARAHFLKARVPEARAAAARARELAARASPREQSHVHALALPIEGKAGDAFEATREHLARWPRDAMALAPATGVFGLIGFSGRQEREAELYEFLRGLAPAYGPDWWFDLTLAFAACETGRLGEARELIERSLSANPASGHGAHVKAHVLYELGECRAGLEFLEAWLPGYDRQGLLHCHLSWHVAIFALALGRALPAWTAYRQAVHPGGSWGPPLNVVTDAASFLWRAELAGEARREGDWREVRDYAQRAFPSAGVTFADVHRALACAASGDATGLGQLARELRERLAAGRLPAGGVVVKLAEGLGAYASGDFSRAASLLGEALPETVRIGGSRAQRDLVVRTLAAAQSKLGRAEQARASLAGRPA
ncbi:MAG TPA: tetratricopeptide repeat protein [Burkholderiales bacterium]|nr:tetratricopeptide repeat protein [Burkholderiales bacterium]